MTKNESLSLYWSGYRAAYSRALATLNRYRKEIGLKEEEYFSKDEIYLRGFESGLDAVENTLLKVIERHKKEVNNG